MASPKDVAEATISDRRSNRQNPIADAEGWIVLTNGKPERAFLLRGARRMRFAGTSQKRTENLLSNGVAD